jgi:hypothetical protein
MTTMAIGPARCGPSSTGPSGCSSPAELETLEAVSVCAGSGGPPEAGSQSQVPRIPPQNPFELLFRQPAPKPLAAVLLGAGDELGSEARVEAATTLDVGLDGARIGHSDLSHDHGDQDDDDTEHDACKDDPARPLREDA